MVFSRFFNSILLVLFFGLNYPNLVLAQKSFGCIKLSGTVKSKGKGLVNVAVSDGKTVVWTDNKGKYRLLTDTLSKFIFISMPSGYKISMDNQESKFFYHLKDYKSYDQKFDFNLISLGFNEDEHRLIVCADPQVGYKEELPLFNRAIKDIQCYIENNNDLPTYGIVCGDLLENLEQKGPSILDITNSFSKTNIPFFYIAGNHDLDMNLRSNRDSKATYERLVGPTYYSFNRGKVHYIIMDDVFYTGRSDAYIGYVDEVQLNWLEQDLAKVLPGSTVILSLHIPTYSRNAMKGFYNKEEINKTVQNRSALYKILSQYSVHILSGHEHYSENYLIGNNIYEHVQSALCGLFWQAPFNSDGTPIGYTVFNINGNEVSWQYKALGKSIVESQFDVYDIGSDKNMPSSFIANVWNYDPYWKVIWYEDGVLMGEMTNYQGWDPNLVSYVEKNKSNFRYKNIGAGQTAHLFYGTPKQSNSQIEVEVIDRFQNKYRMKPRKI